MYLVANVALVVEWAKFRRRGIRKNAWLWVVVPRHRRRRAGHPASGVTCARASRSPYNILPWLTLGLIAVGVIYAVVLGVARPDGA